MIRPAFDVLGPTAESTFCDHASNHIPPELNDLGLSAADIARQIAWDPEAACIAEKLSNRFDSPAILCSTSRLVIDCNRQRTVSDLIPEVSGGTMIPGNQNLDEHLCLARLEILAGLLLPRKRLDAQHGRPNTSFVFL